MPTPDPQQRSAACVGPVRCALGGALMGAANLVPGVSGGTMLLASGVYDACLHAAADLSSFRWCRRSLVTAAAVAVSAAVAVALLAGPVHALVVGHRWLTYSLFVGLTLGGAPLLWRLVRPVTFGALVAAVCGFGVMATLAFVAPSGLLAGGSWWLLLIAGAAAAAAMILPGVSGAYLLLVLGQYEPILDAVRSVAGAAAGLLKGSGWDAAAARAAAGVLLPTLLGAAVGIAAISNSVRAAMRLWPRASHGALLGLLLGAVLGLWPFRRGAEPAVGDVVEGVIQTEASLALLGPAGWPLEPFAPEAWQVVAAVVVGAAGFAATLLLDRLPLSFPSKGAA